MRFEQKRTNDTEERILPLINVVFLLLIFFMVAGSLSLSEPFDIQPLQSENGDHTVVRQDVLRILLSADGQLALDGEKVDKETLLNRIREHLAATPKPGIQLKADGETAGNHVVSLMEDLRRVGVEEVRLLAVPMKS